MASVKGVPVAGAGGERWSSTRRALGTILMRMALGLRPAEVLRALPAQAQRACFVSEHLGCFFISFWPGAPLVEMKPCLIGTD